ncbi:hypothetical protein EEB14_36765 [Rhodococcus sp. WS4]|nr:hypothetical protein EEB14_36765 [Rhodococcus sp. WS4]
MSRHGDYLPPAPDWVVEPVTPAPSAGSRRGDRCASKAATIDLQDTAVKAGPGLLHGLPYVENLRRPIAG